jgi:hypothetical protein
MDRMRHGCKAFLNTVTVSPPLQASGSHAQTQSVAGLSSESAGFGSWSLLHSITTSEAVVIEVEVVDSHISCPMIMVNSELRKTKKQYHADH